MLATRLCTHKEDVATINSERLTSLSDKRHVFEARDSDLTHTPSLDRLCPVGEKVVLKVGAQVMLTRNVDVKRELVNGARGVVTGFESSNTGGCTVDSITNPQFPTMFSSLIQFFM